MAEPHATTEAPTLVGKDFATMHGVLTDTGGLPCEVRFLYRTRDWPDWYASPWTAFDSAPTLFYSPVTGLVPQGMKEYMVQARNADGTFDALVVRYWMKWRIDAYDGSPFLAYNYQAEGPFEDWTLSLTTDVHCHMTMHVDNNVPFRKTGEHYKRGIVYMHTPLTFFSPRWTVEQNEGGDTLAHTFTWHCKKPNGKYTFQGTATTWDRLSPSKTPFYYIKCKPTPPPVATSDQCLVPDANLGFCQYGNANGGRFTPDHDYILTSLHLRLNQYGDIRRGPVSVTIRRVGGDCWSESVLWEDIRWSLSYPPDGSQAWTALSTGALALTQGVAYRIVVMCLPGWEIWYGGQWIPGDNYAGMKVWVCTNFTCYPRGNYCHGCNFKFNRGPWTETDYDLNFACYEQPSA